MVTSEDALMKRELAGGPWLLKERQPLQVLGTPAAIYVAHRT